MFDDDLKISLDSNVSISSTSMFMILLSSFATGLSENSSSKFPSMGLPK